MSMPKLDIREIIQVLEAQGLSDQAQALRNRLNPTLVNSVETARKLAKQNKLTIAREAINEVVNWILANHPNPEAILNWFRRRVGKDD
jgi:ABC-type phosphate/phosphonate transport system ATPase subunit